MVAEWQTHSYMNERENIPFAAVSLGRAIHNLTHGLRAQRMPRLPRLAAVVLPRADASCAARGM
jgi:hypothetical protein